MAVSVHQNPQGQFWPLGNIAVPAPGTPVAITSLIDAARVNAPESATSPTSREYTERCSALIFQPFKAGAAPPRLAANTGVIYIVLKSVGAGGVNDVGTVIAALRPTDPPLIISAAALNRNSLGLYQFYIDADTAADGCQVTAVMQ